MQTQSTNHILMVRPAAFGYNTYTAQDNAFQHKPEDGHQEEILAQAQLEFDGFVECLKAKGIDVTVVFDTPEPKKTDAIFPNNWFTTHPDGTVVTYPMYAPVRRWERRRGVFELLQENFTIGNEHDLSHYEEDDLFLEGTGSLIFDRQRNICYASLSKRTSLELLSKVKEILACKMITFSATDRHGQEIYHTNVMMSVATEFAVICFASIADAKERDEVKQQLTASGKEIIDVSFSQMEQFTCNVLEVSDASGKCYLTMSERAYKAFTSEQLNIIRKYAEIIHSPLYTIENIGGGGSRCMMAEIFLPEKQ